jgi:hypothetical protein
MNVRNTVFLCIINLASFITVCGSFQDKGLIITKQEECEAQQTAQQFVKRMLETRDVAPLIDEMFLSDFISHFVSGDDSMSPSLYSNLKHTERLHLFVAQSNATYLATLDAIYKPKRKLSADERYKEAFKSILSPVLAERLQNVVWPGNEFRFSSYKDFQSRISKIEKVLSEARSYLISQGIEQTPEFQEKLNNTIKGTGVNYHVREYIGGDKIKDCEPLVGFPANQKFFRVETPLLIGVILVKDNNQMKIVRLTYVDED